MRRAYKFLLRPTVRQATALGDMLRDHCSLYNGALEERRTAYRTKGVTVRYGGQSAQLKDIRAFDPERQGRWSFSSQQATLRRLEKAMQAFFRRVKSGERPGYPRFRGLGRFDTVEFPKDGDGCRWDSAPHGAATRLRLQGVGHVRVHQHRPVKGRVKTVSVKREGHRWYVVLSCDDVPVEPLPSTGAVVGSDMGVTHFLTTSDGVHVENPRHGQKAADDLAGAQRAVAAFGRRKSTERTKKHRAAVAKVAALHRKVRRQRLDHAHKVANFVVRGADVIAHERLSIKAMVRSPRSRKAADGTYEPNGAAAKSGLSKSILDAGWGVFLGLLANKAESAGRRLVPVNPRNTSRTCPACGHVDGQNRDRENFECTACGYVDHADRVGALNVLDGAGLALCAAAWPPAQEARGFRTICPFAVGGVTHTVGTEQRTVIPRLKASAGPVHRRPERPIRGTDRDHDAPCFRR